MMLSRLIFLLISFLLTSATPIFQHPGHASENSKSAKITFLDIIHKFNDTILSAGETLAIPCVWVSTPVAVVKWKFNGMDIPGPYLTVESKEQGRNDAKYYLSFEESESILNIPCVNSQNTGVYTCIVSNGNKTVEHSAAVYIEGEVDCGKTVVQQPPLIFESTKDRWEYANNTAVLICRAENADEISWDFKETPLQNGGRYEILSTGDLVIRNIVWEDLGIYTCTASNEFGQTKSETFLYPAKNPSTSD